MADGSEAQVHWLVVGSFGLGEAGRSVSLTRADFDTVLRDADLAVTVEVPDAIGTAGARSFSIDIGSLSALSLKKLVAGQDELRALAAKADELGRLREPTVDGVRDIVGEGPLLDAAAQLLAPAPAEPDDANEAVGSVDAIFERADVGRPSVKRAIDMFVQKGRVKTGATPSPRSVARQLRDLMEAAVYTLASEVLGAEEVQAVERAWRGLRWLATQCPRGASMEIRLLQATPDEALAVLRDRERRDGIDEPDAIFLPFDVAGPETLAALADFAEEEMVPLVVGLDPALFGQDDHAAVPEAFEALERAQNEEPPAWTKAWDQLRLAESTRWLCGVANRMVLHQEGAGAAQRTVFGSGVWAVAALLATSVRETGGFGRIAGPPGAISGPATHVIDRPGTRDVSAPTEAFYAIRSLEVLGKNGVLGVGSSRNSDRVLLLRASMVRGAKDAVPLSAQMLTGRVVRFATWVKPQLPDGVDSATANEIYGAAASVFLFPAQEEAAKVTASVIDIDGAPHVLVEAQANPAIAGTPFEISFPLPL